MANQKLNIVITAFDKTKSAFRGISAGDGAVTSAVFSLKTALVGVVGAAGIGLLVRNSLQATDALSKTAQKLGVTTQELSALRYAAELSGVGIQTTDMAVQRFTRRLAEAAQGTGEAKGALRELNIDAAELSKLPLQEQMFALADAFGNVKNANDQVRLGFKLFDSEGLAFINTLKEGREGLSAMFAEADRLGVLLSTDAAQGVERANDAFTKLGTLLKGVTDQTVAALAPALEDLATFLTETFLEKIEEGTGGVRQLGIALADYLLLAIGKAIIGLGEFVESVVKLSNRVLEVIYPLANLVGLMDNLNQVGPQFANSLKSAGEFVLSLRDSLGRPGSPEGLNGALSDTEEKFTNTEKLLQKVGKAFQNATKQSTDLQDTLNSGVQKAMKATTDGLADMVLGAKSAKDAFKDMARSIINDLARMFIQQQITQPLFNTIGGFFNPASSATPSGAPTNPILSGNGGGFTGLGARAGGIDGKGGFPAILHPNETVIDHTKGQGMGGAVSVTLNISTGVSQTVRAEIANLMPQITEATKGAVLEARQRGGSYSRGLAGI